MRFPISIFVIFLVPVVSIAQYDDSQDCGGAGCPEMYAQLDDYTIRMAERSKFRTLAEQRRVVEGMPANFIVIAWGKHRKIEPSGSGDYYSENWWYRRQ